MSLGSSLYHAWKKSGLSQENVAEKLGVSRQTISKWETNETLPDIRQSKRLSLLYHMTLDELIEYDFDEQQARQMIDRMSFATTEQAATIAPSPIRTPGMMTHSRPIQTSFPITVSPFRGSWSRWGGVFSCHAPPNTWNG